MAPAGAGNTPEAWPIPLEGTDMGKANSVVLVDGVPSKRCPTCDETKPVEEGFGWRTQNGKQYPMSRCRSCHNGRKRAGQDGRYARTTPPPPPPPPAGYARCSRCRNVKVLGAFPRSKNRTNGRYFRCKQCVRDERLQNLRKHRDQELRRRFGIGLDDYEELLERQGGGCAICGAVVSLDGRSLAVDHDHACCPGRGRCCGRCVRGVLCVGCNTGLGSFRDEPALLLAAVAYLQRRRAALGAEVA